MLFSRRSTALLAAASLFAFGAARAALPRFPQPYGDRVVFVADGSIWSVAKSGGSAQRLTSAAGQDLFPRLSPDGRWIAYTEASKAGTDIWVIPANGGAARRLTFHPTTEAGTGGRHGPDNMVVTWTPDSKSVVYLSKQKQWNTWIQNMFAVPVDGGLPTAMPIDSAVGLATYGPDGHSIAYNRIFRNFRTWKRYNGGLAQQVFTYDFATKQLTQLTDLVGHQHLAYVVGRRIYFLSDRDANRRANIWVYDEDTKQTRQVTHFTDLDIDFPALGGDAIAFQQGGRLFTLDLPSEKLSEVSVQVGDDNVRTRPRAVAVKDQIRDSDIAQQVDFALAPNGKRTLFSARGDVFSVPTEDGATRDLTGTQGVDEDHPTWSPDGRTVAYTTDVGGEQQIATRPAEGGPERVLTTFKDGYLYGPMFSPDGRSLAFSDSAHRLWLVGVDIGGPARQVAQDKFGEIHDQAFSPDGRWLSFSLSADFRRRDLYLFEIASGKTTKLGDSSSTDFGPVWSPDGKYLYFVSNRHENPVPSDAEFDFSIVKSLGLYAIPLARDTVSPMAPRSDEADSGPEPAGGPGPPRDAAGRAGRGAASDDKGQKGEKAKPSPDQPGPIAPIRIDLDGLMSRAVALPIEPGNIAAADARGDRLIYLTQPLSLIEGPLNGEKSALHVFDFKTRKDAVIAQDVDSYSLALNGQRVLIKRKGDYIVVDTKADAEKDADATKKLDLDRMRVLADPIQEWSEMFDNAWRLERDFFFSPVMNGQDWPAVRVKYRALLPALGSREDLNYLIGQMLGEMGNSHTYVGGGDDADTTPAVHGALLGVDWALDAASGRYRIATIYPGDNTREAYRSPLSQPGLNVHAGDYLLAVNGVELRAPTDPDSLMQLADAETTVDLTVSDSPTGARRRIVVRPIEKELGVREAAWIAGNRATVDRLSGGRIGYVYMSDMEQLGLQQFVRQFFSQLHKQALIMDDRWNGGGFIAPYTLERLRRTLVMLEVNREGAIASEPLDVLNGPKVALLNHWSASDGDIFPNLFKAYGLGKLIGTRSWGGVRGIRGNMTMMDGGYVTVPESAPYTPERVWSVENHGVDPDIEVENMPADLLAGHDAQLETAVAVLLEQIKGKAPGYPTPPPLLPPYPPSGMVPPQP